VSGVYLLNFSSVMLNTFFPVRTDHCRLIISFLSGNSKVQGYGGARKAKLISSITVTGVIGKRAVWRKQGIEFCWVDNLTFQITASGSIHLRSSITHVVY
jgi:hypothetical protein